MSDDLAKEALLRRAAPRTSEGDVDAELSRRSLLEFAHHTLPRYRFARHLGYLAGRLEALAAGEIDRLMIHMPPRHGKTELVTQRFPAWYLGRHPDRQIISVSHGASLSADFGRVVRDIVGGEAYRNIFPGTTLNPATTAAERWTTLEGGIYIAAGTGTGIPGRGAHFLNIDDPHAGRREANSPRQREDIWKWYNGVALNRLMPGGAVCLTQTRWHEDDLSGRLLEAQKKGGDQWEVVTLPALAVEGDLLGRALGEALWPEWWPRESLLNRRAALTALDGPGEWESQYQQNPHIEGGDFFRKEWFQYFLLAHAPAHMNIYGASDYAVSEGSGDWTVHIIAGVDPAYRIYLLDLWRQRASADVWVDAHLDLHTKWRPVWWAQEKGQILKGVGPFLTRRSRERQVYPAYRKYASSTRKEMRAASITGRFAQGMVYIPSDAPWTDALASELLRFPGGVHDDQVDALSLFGRMLSEMAPGQEPPEPVPVDRDYSGRGLVQQADPDDWRLKGLGARSLFGH